MIELLLELNIDSFLVNSKSDSRVRIGMGYVPTKTLTLSCKNVVSTQQLPDNMTSLGLTFSGSANEREIEDDKEFDNQLLSFLTSHSTVDTSMVNIASESPDYKITPDTGVSKGEIGRMILIEQSGQTSINLELALKHDEFEAVWELMTQQKIPKVLATVACFNQGWLVRYSHTPDKTMIVAGVLSCSLRMTPNLQSA